MDPNMEQLLAWVLERMNTGWRDDYREQHGFEVGAGNDESEREAVGNLIWSEMMAREQGQGPSQEQYEQHYQGYRSGPNEEWEQYLALADAILAQGSPPPAPVEAAPAASGPYDRDPLTDPMFDVPLQERRGQYGASGGTSPVSSASGRGSGGTSSGTTTAPPRASAGSDYLADHYANPPRSSAPATTSNPRGSGPDSDIPLSERGRQGGSSGSGSSAPATPYRAQSGAYDHMIPRDDRPWAGGMASAYTSPPTPAAGRANSGRVASGGSLGPWRAPSGAYDNMVPSPRGAATPTPTPARTTNPTPTPTPTGTPRAMNQRAQEEARRRAMMQQELMRHLMRETVPPVRYAPTATGTPVPTPTPPPYGLPRTNRR